MALTQTMAPSARVNILGVGISAVDLTTAVSEVDSWISRRVRRYVNVCTVHTVMECQRDPRLRNIVNGSGLSTPDGMPLVWLSRLNGQRTASRVYGPDLMLALCKAGQSKGYRHYFYGGAPGIVERLTARLQKQFPQLIVAGSCTPPPRLVVGAREPQSTVEAINNAKPDIVWVGLGTPKQDYWVSEHRHVLEAPALIAVGAAFDFHAGVLRQAPRWIQQSGLEWLFRLSQEPRRLARRYLLYNPAFVFLTALQVSGFRRYTLDGSEPRRS